MRIRKTPFEGLLIIEPDVFEDNRGNFFEAYNKKDFYAAGIDVDFIQDNQSQSRKNVIRGLHFQYEPYAQTKLMRSLYGRILDVVVDLRKGEKTFGKIFTLEISAENRLQLLVPKGFAHGFSVLSDSAIIHYKCDNYYQPNAAGGIRFDDSALGISWEVHPADAIVSQKDLTLPSFAQVSETL